MGNAESGIKHGDESTQGSESIRMLTEEEFNELPTDQQHHYIAEYEKYIKSRENGVKDQSKSSGRQRHLETINAIKKLPSKFGRNNSDGLSSESANNFSVLPRIPAFNQGQSRQRQAPPTANRHRQLHELQHKVSTSQPQQEKQIQHNKIFRQSQSYPQHQLSYEHEKSYSQVKGDQHLAKSSLIMSSSNPNQSSYSKTSNDSHQTVSVMMYPAHQTHSSSNAIMDATRMVKSMKVEENDWETRWENDDNDDDSYEDEEKEIDNKTMSKLAQHSFRPGIDFGHSISTPMKSRLNTNQTNQNTLPIGHPNGIIESDAASTNVRLNRQTSPESRLQREKKNTGDRDESNIEDRPGVKMFSKLRVLGKGSFGKVVLVRKRSGPDRGNLFAMKILRKSHLLRKCQIERTKTERKVLSIVSHPFIMKLHFAFQTDDKLYFVLEYCAGGELFFHLSRYRRFPERVARFYAAELLLAIGHLHRRKIIFRDLKPENVLLDASGHIKLGDFGLSKDRISDPCQGATSFCGTPEYMAPEVIRRDGHGFCVDYWGLGMLVYEMMTSLPPWYTTDRSELSRRILYSPLEIPNYMSSVSSYFVSSLLERNPRKRLGVYGVISVMENHFFKEINWKMLVSKRVQPEIKPCEGWRAESMMNDYDLGKNSNSNFIENNIDRYTSNFEKHFTRMPVNTEDHNIDPQYSGSDYGSVDVPENTFVGFTFDEIDNNASSAKVGARTTTKSANKQAMGSRHKAIHQKR